MSQDAKAVETEEVDAAAEYDRGRELATWPSSAAPRQDDSPGARQGLARDAPGTRQGRARDSPGESGEGEPAEELRATASARSRSRSPPRRMPCDRIDLSGFVNWTSAGGEAAVVEAACHRILQVNSDGGPSYIGVTMDAWERLHGMKEDQRHFPKWH